VHPSVFRWKARDTVRMCNLPCRVSEHTNATMRPLFQLLNARVPSGPRSANFSRKSGISRKPEIWPVSYPGGLSVRCMRTSSLKHTKNKATHGHNACHRNDARSEDLAHANLHHLWFLLRVDRRGGRRRRMRLGLEAVEYRHD
jgi:hypothetical protein